MNTYVLKTGTQAKEVLDRQHLIFAKKSYKHLIDAGLSPGQVVWDLGCGSGIMTEHLAKIVEQTGHVYALDISKEQIEVSQNRLIESGLKNVTFITGDIATADLPTNKADIVYARFFLMHQTEPQKIIAKMHSLLKPGGVLVLQESTMSTVHFSIKNVEIEKYVNAIVNLGKSRSVDFNIGRRLSELCKDAGFEKIESHYELPKISAQDAAPVFLARMNELQDEITKAGIATQDEINHWKKTAEKFFAEADQSFYVVFAEQAYILARKKNF